MNDSGGAIRRIDWQFAANQSAPGMCNLYQSESVRWKTYKCPIASDHWLTACILVDTHRVFSACSLHYAVFRAFSVTCNTLWTRSRGPSKTARVCSARRPTIFAPKLSKNVCLVSSRRSVVCPLPPTFRQSSICRRVSEEWKNEQMKPNDWHGERVKLDKDALVKVDWERAAGPLKWLHNCYERQTDVVKALFSVNPNLFSNTPLIHVWLISELSVATSKEFCRHSYRLPRPSLESGSCLTPISTPVIPFYERQLYEHL